MTVSESVCDVDDFRQETYGSRVAMESSDTASLKRERARFMTTIDSLTDDEFDIGTTLCEGWAPRDVLAHIIGTQDMLSYFRPGGLTIARANAKMVADCRALGRAELSELGWRAATEPSLSARFCAHSVLIGDVVMHHQDVLRGLGKPHDLPPEARAAIIREGTVWSRSKLLRYRVIPSDGVPARGVGQRVYGTTEALAMWLAGRESVSADLEFETVTSKRRWGRQ